MRRVEERLGPLAGDVLDLVDDLVAAVVALARVALAVLVGEDGARGAQHGGRREVLAGDQLDGGVLALDLAVDQRQDLVVRVARPVTISALLVLDVGDLGDPPLVAAALEGRGEPELEDLRRQAGGDDAPTHGEHVGVVVLAAQARGVQVVAQRGPHAVHLVGGDLLALARAAEHDAPVGLAGHHGAADGGTDGRVVDRVGAVGAEVDRLVAPALELHHEVSLQVEPRVVGTDGHLHALRSWWRSPIGERQRDHALRAGCRAGRPSSRSRPGRARSGSSTSKSSW